MCEVGCNILSSYWFHFTVPFKSHSINWLTVKLLVKYNQKCWQLTVHIYIQISMVLCRRTPTVIGVDFQSMKAEIFFENTLYSIKHTDKLELSEVYALSQWQKRNTMWWINNAYSRLTPRIVLECILCKNNESSDTLVKEIWSLIMFTCSCNIVHEFRSTVGSDYRGKFPSRGSVMAISNLFIVSQMSVNRNWVVPDDKIWHLWIRESPIHILLCEGVTSLTTPY